MSDTSFDSPYLIQAETLEARLDDPNLRLFDCTQRLVPDPERGVRAENCKAEFDEAHIPGAGYLDLAGELSDTTSRWRYTCPAPDDLAARFAKRGIGPDSQVVLYDTTMMMWATRVWLMLRSLGHNNVAVLDGGLSKWLADGRPTSSEPDRYPPAAAFPVTTSGTPFVDKDTVLAALAAPETTVVNALSAEQHAGGGIQYGRPGRITGTVNVVARDLTDADTGLLKSPDEIRALFAAADVDLDKPVLCYCGGGIAATLDTFALTLLGAKEITVYDASLQEWATDDSLPMETD